MKIKNTIDKLISKNLTLEMLKSIESTLGGKDIFEKYISIISKCTPDIIKSYLEKYDLKDKKYIEYIKSNKYILLQFINNEYDDKSYITSINKLIEEL